MRMVPLSTMPRDYKLVMQRYGARYLRGRKFNPWSAQTGPHGTPTPPHRFKESIMNTRTLIAFATLSFAAAGAAVAQEATSDAWMQAAATTSRAQVTTELAQARADGSIKAVSAGYMPTLKASQPRADVVAATMAALRNGEIDRIDSEAYAFQLPTHTSAAVNLARAGR